MSESVMLHSGLETYIDRCRKMMKGKMGLTLSINTSKCPSTPSTDAMNASVVRWGT